MDDVAMLDRHESAKPGVLALHGPCHGGGRSAWGGPWNKQLGFFFAGWGSRPPRCGEFVGADGVQAHGPELGARLCSHFTGRRAR